jgi:phosphoglycolate phosphatase-like HAD superfamily hydrolase
MKNLIIFDFDDTVVDNSKLDYMGFKIPCQKLNVEFPTKTKLIRFRKNGMIAKEIFQRFSNDKNKLNEFLKLRKLFLKNKSFKYLVVKPYSSLVFKKLINNKNELIISSINDNPKMINKFLKEKNLDHFFKNFFSIDSLNISLENNSYSNRILIKTSLLKIIIKTYKNSFEDFIFIGNSLEDFYAAKKLKIKFIYLLNPYLPIPKLNSIKKISHMKQILDLLIEEKK